MASADAGAVHTVADDLAAFQAAAAFVIDRLEGGARIVDDTGGTTKWGISQRAYPDVDIVSLTREHALRLYRADYWQRMRCYDLPRPVALAVFDAAVNMGVVQAARLLQKTLKIREDGIVGPRTVAEVLRVDPVELVACYLGERLRFYRLLAESKPGVYRTSLNGWSNRVCRVGVECGRWAGIPEPTPADVRRSLGGVA